ncbi:hypothetical protein [Nannocystis bainbridge]|uniref:Uncharacterized protein n=1 Tax=Nannocystis bainbridge TaxID=2995303 RepID=A0ABT5EB22_9BACT|nr:hypothetical protein [Nannocystis bainbridge]MDC0723064.1 hypothetical protein [Nannocystis bainbridge]
MQIQTDDTARRAGQSGGYHILKMQIKANFVSEPRNWGVTALEFGLTRDFENCYQSTPSLGSAP